MSVLASYEKLGSTELCYISTVKGAPETLRGMVHANILKKNILISCCLYQVYPNMAVIVVCRMSCKL